MSSLCTVGNIHNSILALQPRWISQHNHSKSAKQWKWSFVHKMFNNCKKENMRKLPNSLYKISFLNSIGEMVNVSLRTPTQFFLNNNNDTFKCKQPATLALKPARAIAKQWGWPLLRDRKAMWVRHKGYRPCIMLKNSGREPCEDDSHMHSRGCVECLGTYPLFRGKTWYTGAPSHASPRMWCFWPLVGRVTKTMLGYQIRNLGRAQKDPLRHVLPCISLPVCPLNLHERQQFFVVKLAKFTPTKTNVKCCI